MTKSELIKGLSNYKDTDEVFLTLPGATQLFYVDKVSDVNGKPVLETDEAPDFSDLVGMAKAHNEEFGGNIAVYQEAV